MKRSLLALVVAALIASGAACSRTTTRPAAVVNGSAISTQSLIDELDALSGNKDYLATVTQARAQKGQKVAGETPGSFDLGFVSSTLRDQIYFRLVHDEFSRQGLSVDDACKAAAKKEVLAQMGSAGSSTDSSESTASTSSDAGASTFERFPKSYQQTLLERFGELLALQAHLAGQSCVADDAAKTYYDAHTQEFEQACGSVVFAKDQATADSVKARLAAGEAFPAVANQVNAGTTAPPDGDIGCKTRGELSTAAAPAFFDTPVGQVSAATPVGSGFIVVLVRSRAVAALDDVRQMANELAATAEQNAFQQYIQQAVSSAAITVDSRYGTWNKAVGDIDPPGSALASTPTDSASGSSGTTGSAPSTEPASSSSSSG